MANLDQWGQKLYNAELLAGKYGEGGANTPVNKDTMPWLYPDDDDGEINTDDIPGEPKQLDLFNDLKLSNYRYDHDPNSLLINKETLGRPGREQGPATLQEHNMKMKIRQMLGMKTAQLSPDQIMKQLQSGAKASQGGASSEELRKILAPGTVQDQFGHPTGSYKGGV